MVRRCSQEEYTNWYHSDAKPLNRLDLDGPNVLAGGVHELVSLECKACKGCESFELKKEFSCKMVFKQWIMMGLHNHGQVLDCKTEFA